MLRFKYLKLQIMAFDLNASCVFALHKCGHKSAKLHHKLALVLARRLLFNGDGGVANRDHAEQ
jgi:hypothetical protein